MRDLGLIDILIILGLLVGLFFLGAREFPHYESRRYQPAAQRPPAPRPG